MSTNRHRYFICKKHSQKLMANPEYAKRIWVRMMNAGRKKGMQNHWNDAVKLYGNAFDTMDILLDDEPQQKNITNYICTGVELIYAIRHSSYTNNLPFLISIIHNRVEALLAPANVDLLIKPVNDMVYKPLSEAKNLLNTIEKHQVAYVSRVH